MNKFWLTIGVVSFLLAGCADSGSESDTQDAADVAPEVVQGEAVKSEAVEFTVSEPEGAVQNQTNVSASAGLNPPHGQPGHDCAIAVGAPLDGSGGQPQAPQAPNAVQPVAQPNFQSGGAPANGLNPPHGQPGHDCAVAVGAPLPAK